MTLRANSQLSTYDRLSGTHRLAGQDYRAADATYRARIQTIRERQGPERLGPER